MVGTVSTTKAIEPTKAPKGIRKASTISHRTKNMIMNMITARILRQQFRGLQFIAHYSTILPVTLNPAKNAPMIGPHE